MLVLSRRRKESIRIGEDIILTVLEICKSEVRIGIRAPKEIPVHREEVHARIQKEKSKLAESKDKG